MLSDEQLRAAISSNINVLASLKDRCKNVPVLSSFLGYEAALLAQIQNNPSAIDPALNSVAHAISECQQRIKSTDKFFDTFVDNIKDALDDSSKLSKKISAAQEGLKRRNDPYKYTAEEKIRKIKALLAERIEFISEIKAKYYTQSIGGIPYAKHCICVAEESLDLLMVKSNTSLFSPDVLLNTLHERMNQLEHLVPCFIHTEEKYAELSQYASRLEERSQDIKSALTDIKKSSALKKYFVGLLMGLALSIFSPNDSSAGSGDRSVVENKSSMENVNLSSAVLAANQGVGTIYGMEFEGRKTASGDVFRHSKISCAVPLRSGLVGKYLRITNLDNGAFVIVQPNDVGNFGFRQDGTPNKYPYDYSRTKKRLIDMSKQLAYELGGINKKDLKGGKNVYKTLNVKVEVLNPSYATTLLDEDRGAT